MSGAVRRSHASERPTSPRQLSFPQVGLRLLPHTIFRKVSRALEFARREQEGSPGFSVGVSAQRRGFVVATAAKRLMRRGYAAVARRSRGWLCHTERRGMPGDYNPFVYLHPKGWWSSSHTHTRSRRANKKGRPVKAAPVRRSVARPRVPGRDAPQHSPSVHGALGRYHSRYLLSSLFSLCEFRSPRFLLESSGGAESSHAPVGNLPAKASVPTCVGGCCGLQ